MVLEMQDEPVKKMMYMNTTGDAQIW